jgi:RimJ/RimL family protein N-acetyltransferase
MNYISKTGQKYILKIAEEADFPAVVDCIRAVYGELYHDPNMYRPEYMHEMQEKGQIEVYAAMSEKSGADSLVGLTKFGFDTSRHAFFGFMTKEYLRGEGLSSTLYNYLVEIIKARRLPAAYGFALTIHTTSQHIVEKLGFVPTGFLFGFCDDAKVSETPIVPLQKRSLAVYTIPMTKKSAGTLYLPQQMHGFAENIYNSLNASFEISTGDDSSVAAETHFESRYNAYHSVSHVRIHRAGRDLAEIVQKIHTRYSAPLDTVTLELDCTDPCAVYGLETLLEQGYIMSGFRPLCEDGEYILLFYQGGAKILYDEIKTTANCREVLDYILRSKEHEKLYL